MPISQEAFSRSNARNVIMILPGNATSRSDEILRLGKLDLMSTFPAFLLANL